MPELRPAGWHLGLDDVVPAALVDRLRRAIGRTMTDRRRGVQVLRGRLPRILGTLRAAGLSDDAIRSMLLALVEDVASATGNDRRDLVTGEPRSDITASVVRQAVDTHAR